jgi:transaldolase
MPEPTVHAFADHGEVRGDTVTPYYADAQKVIDDLARIGVDYDDVVDTLEREGVEKFAASWNELLESVNKSLEAAKSGADRPNRAAADVPKTDAER